MLYFWGLGGESGSRSLLCWAGGEAGMSGLPGLGSSGAASVGYCCSGASAASCWLGSCCDASKVCECKSHKRDLGFGKQAATLHLQALTLHAQ